MNALDLVRRCRCYHVRVHTHTHTYIYNSESAIEIEHPIYSSFFLLFFFLSPLAMDRRIAFSLLSISIHLSIVAFHAYYNYFWFVWSPWDNRNWNSFQSLVVLRWISLTVSLDVHPLGILIRFNDFNRCTMILLFFFYSIYTFFFHYSIHYSIFIW